MIVETFIFSDLLFPGYSIWKYLFKGPKDKKEKEKELNPSGFNSSEYSEYSEWKKRILEYVRNKDQVNLSRIEKLFSDFENECTIENYSKIMGMLATYLNGKPRISQDSSTPTPTDLHPTVFISYSWDDEEHEKWVLNLATYLTFKGIDVILDKWEMTPGKPLPHFMENAVRNSGRVICVITPNYKKKTDNLEGGVGVEYSIISAEIQQDVKTEKFIPLLRKGSRDDVPTFLKGRVSVDMREGANYDKSIDELVRALWGEPKYRRPEVGPKPKFD